ncbi:MAG: hypothetical protein J6Q92_03760 [Oscillospiraceae bacterium]|nr:hypothetical protein [Oscillospiraceae bacterium]
MLSVNKFFEEVSYKEIVASLVEIMAENFEDFAADQARYKKSLSWSEKELAEGTALSVEKLVNAIDQQIGSTILFSYFLGLKANWDHFIDPIGRTFLDVDTEVYLREDMAKRLPDYQNAQRTQEQFYASLTPAQQERYEDITSYICHLETVGPKLAHYYGYLLGNQLFPRIIPGYGEDTPFTFQYRNILENYLGIRINQPHN